MFGSISNWITTTSTNISSNIPPVNIPNIPELFGKTNAKTDSESQVATNLNDTNVVKVNKTEDDAVVEDVPTAASVAPNIEETKNITNPIENNEEKVGVINQLDIDAQKAYGQAKEIGSNIGSKHKKEDFFILI